MNTNVVFMISTTPFYHSALDLWASRGSILLFPLSYERKTYKKIPDRATEETMYIWISINYFPAFYLNQST